MFPARLIQEYPVVRAVPSGTGGNECQELIRDLTLSHPIASGYVLIRLEGTSVPMPDDTTEWSRLAWGVQPVKPQTGEVATLTVMHEQITLGNEQEDGSFLVDPSFSLTHSNEDALYSVNTEFFGQEAEFSPDLSGERSVRQWNTDLKSLSIEPNDNTYRGPIPILFAFTPKDKTEPEAFAIRTVIISSDHTGDAIRSRVGALIGQLHQREIDTREINAFNTFRNSLISASSSVAKVIDASKTIKELIDLSRQVEQRQELGLNIADIPLAADLEETVRPRLVIQANELALNPPQNAGTAFTPFLDAIKKIVDEQVELTQEVDLDDFFDDIDDDLEAIRDALVKMRKQYEDLDTARDHLAKDILRQLYNRRTEFVRRIDAVGEANIFAFQDAPSSSPAGKVKAIVDAVLKEPVANVNSPNDASLKIRNASLLNYRINKQEKLQKSDFQDTKFLLSDFCRLLEHADGTPQGVINQIEETLDALQGRPESAAKRIVRRWKWHLELISKRDSGITTTEGSEDGQITDLNSLLSGFGDRLTAGGQNILQLGFIESALATQIGDALNTRDRTLLQHHLRQFRVPESSAVARPRVWVFRARPVFSAGMPRVPEQRNPRPRSCCPDLCRPSRPPCRTEMNPGST